MPSTPNRPGAWFDGSLVALALAATILIFVPGLIEQFETPKAEVIRVCGFAALTVALVCGRRGWPGWHPIDSAVALWLAVELLSAASSVAPATSVIGSIAQREGLLTSLALAGLYAAARRSAGDPRAVTRTLNVCVLAACLASLYALAQAAGLDPAPWYGTAEYGAGATFRRPFGTLGHPNLLGVVSTAALPIALARLWTGAAPRLGWALATVTLALATIVSLSRAAWLGGLAGMAAALMLLWRGGRAPSRRMLWIAAAALAALLVALVVVRGPVTTRSTELLSTGGSGAARFEIWRSALAAWRARPLLGQGPDTFELTYPRYQTPGYWRLEWGLQPFHAHSIYLHALATRGIAGLLAGIVWAAALALALRAAWRAGGDVRALAATLAGLLIALGVSGAFGALGMSGALIAVVASGTLAGALAAPPPARAVPARAALVAGLLVGLAAWVWAVVELRAAWSAGEAREHTDAAPQLAAAARAEALAPWEDGYARLHAEALERVALRAPDRARVLAEAEAAARRAVALAPLRSLDHRRLGSVLAGGVMPGDSVAGAAAVAAFQRALALAPADGVSWMELARLELYLGRPQAALEPARRAAAMYPAVARTHALLAEALLGVGDRAGARDALERAMAGDWRGDDDARRAAEMLREALREPAPR